MNINKVKKQLKKINNLVEAIEGEGKASSIEKDLLKSYVQDLYEKITTGKHETASAPAPQPVVKQEAVAKNIVQEPTLVAAPVSIPEPVVEKSIFAEAPAPIAVPEVKPVVKLEPVLADAIDVPNIPATNGYAPSVQPSIESTVTEIEEVQSETSPLSSEVLELFSDVAIADLSDRLANMPIKDLSKSMGLNERVFTVNELFAGNNQLFNEIIQHLNGLTSFTEAKEFLGRGIAEDQNWTSDYKVKKAAKFIQLVRRRYLS